jgi:hypothetical protein
MAEMAAQKNGIDVRHFRLLAQTKRRTKAALVRQVWPEIKSALAAGHRLKDVQNWLNEVGIEIGYDARLSDYIGQLKRCDAGLVASTAVSETQGSAMVHDKSTLGHRRTHGCIVADRRSTGNNMSAGRYRLTSAPNRKPEVDPPKGETKYRENAGSNISLARTHALSCPQTSLQTKPSTNKLNIEGFLVAALPICTVVFFALGFLVGRMP